MLIASLFHLYFQKFILMLKKYKYCLFYESVMNAQYFIIHTSNKRTVPKRLSMSLHKVYSIDSLHLMLKKDEVISICKCEMFIKKHCFLTRVLFCSHHEGVQMPASVYVCMGMQYLCYKYYFSDQQIFPGLILSDIKPAKRMKFKTVCYLLVQLMHCRKMFKAEIPFSNVMTCEDDDKVGPSAFFGHQFQDCIK